MKQGLVTLISCATFFINASNASVLDIQHFTTSNGLKVYFVAANEVPMLDIKIGFHAGSAYDGRHWGLAALTNESMAQGAGGFDAQAMAEKFESVGAQFSYGVDRDMAYLSLRTLTLENQLNQAVSAFTAVLGQPNFTQKAISREKNQQLQAILAQKQTPAAIASTAFYQQVYQQHPYAHPVLGESASVTALTTNDVKRFFQQFYNVKQASLAMIGAIDLNKAKAIADTLSQQLPNHPVNAPLPQATPLKKAFKQHIDYPATQTVIRMGQVGINHQSPDYYPLVVGNYTLGGGTLVSRLSDEVREKRGLTYGVYSYFSPMPERGPFVIGLATKQQSTKKALSVTQKTLADFIQQGPTDKELNAAKRYIAGSFPLRLSSNRQIVDSLLAIGFYHLPLRYLDDYLAKVQTVSRAQIRNAFQATITPSRFVTITVGKA